MKSVKIILTACVVLCFLTCSYLVLSTNTNADSNAICVDNTIKIAVYLPDMSTVIYDPLCTAMFFSNNLDYLNDSNIANKLTTSNYTLLLVPKKEISNTTSNCN